MGKHLVIVESPAKAHTIHKFLGQNYLVKACMGHIRDLPKSKLGIDVENDFRPKYMIIPAKSTLVKELKSDASKVETVFLATDLDREGEAIAWHLCEALRVPPAKVSRVVFNEITGNAIRTAFQNPGQIQMNKVYAQQARRSLDRLVGYLVSPLLWEKIARGLSAGRVQSVAVRLIVEKEMEIQAFESKEYWEIAALLSSATRLNDKFQAYLKKIDNKKASLADGNQAKEIVERLQNKDFKVIEVVRKEKREAPYPPFTTSHLQQQASIQLKFRAQHTMAVAQQLYEGLELGATGPVGLITYMRTDSFVVSQEAIEECRKFIGENFAQCLPPSPNVYQNKKEAQGAHEAIRPSSVYRTPQSLVPFLSSDQHRLYKLIWERFVASQMAAARYAITTVSIEADNCLFESKGKEVLFAGYTILQNGTAESEEATTGKEDKILPPLQENEILQLHELKPGQHFTQPPPRYSEATLVKMLEAKGIGRPSTYAPIITTIQERGYVKLQDRKFWATDLGIKVTDQLSKYFTRIMDYNFTAQLEDKLDQIEENTVDWVTTLREFYDPFSQDLKTAYDQMDNIKKNPEASSYACQICGAPMIYRYNKDGKFLGCSKYPACKNAVPLDKEGNPIFPKATEYKCEKCAHIMVLKQGKSGKFLACSAPECTYTLPVGIDGKPILPEPTDTSCPLCGAAMIKRKGPTGLFLACSRYPECKKTMSLSNKPDLSKLIAAKCELCDKPMTIRTGKKGVFVGCTGYPDCKNLKRFSTDLLNLPPQYLEIKCDLCGSPMKMRSSHKGLFWGCSNYPKCNFTKPCDLYEIATHCQEKNT